jgi:hypothetical protein
MLDYNYISLKNGPGGAAAYEESPDRQKISQGQSADKNRLKRAKSPGKKKPLKYRTYSASRNAVIECVPIPLFVRLTIYAAERSLTITISFTTCAQPFLRT